MSLQSFELNESRFIDLLTKLINECKYVQNSPSQGLIPQEDRISSHVMELLEPFTTKHGGILEVERVSFVEGRGNLIIKYPGTTKNVISCKYCES